MNSPRKLQVFVSSTYLDLKAERQAAVEAILQAGHIPAGMELFAAGDESQWETIKRWIDESDAYMLILGERYGSVEPKTGKSYTQLEYEYALTAGKRVFALVLDDGWVRRKYQELGRDAADEHRAEHKAFKALVLSKICAEVRDEPHLQLHTLRSLANIERDDTLGGWVRANDLIKSEALVVELRKTVEDLRARPPLSQPNASEIQAEVRERISELLAWEIDESGVFFDGLEGRNCNYYVKGNAAAIVVAGANSLAAGISRSSLGGIPIVIFYKLNAMLHQWGFTAFDGRLATLTPKGEYLVQTLHEMKNTNFVPFNVVSTVNG